MLETLTIRTQRTTASRLALLDPENLEFGKTFTDHMFVVDYCDGEWQEPQIVPYGDITVSPANSALHYGQAIFEGMKAYKNEQGDIAVFRPEDNLRRLNASAERMCMPAVPEELFMQGLLQLIKLDAEWVPNTQGTSLYIRPFMFATDGMLGVRPSDTYRFMIITCPVGAFYNKALRVRFEEKYVRSAEGGAGYAKNAGNYGASMYPTKLAQQEGYNQLLWTDASEHRYIEESGTMNVAFVIGGKLITPALSTSILDGITRRSVLQLARDWGMTVEERKVSAVEVLDALAAGTLEEAFGVGTAATIAPIAVIGYQGQDHTLPTTGPQAFSRRVSDALTAIRTGAAPDTHGWMVQV
ncbi:MULTISPECIES: branched-chain amino acid aminotransferase [Hymenobacter]|uniref:branched-chain-amino-acid transaminase n=1 Tax=Hymenobacter jejuensis TaxID=2502781 RepID=A0A5B8A1T3_9BACT|nr:MULTISPECIES: branched-chain amino acid aminotransferase [Hymenobacter]MBC6990502.1 branched-chain amino acid aminotransferase [Hymenobacter sp. BT491]QDA61079.1 branched-chain amino acid aminotransferase [Hymenobacter jejuensis]